MEMPHQQDHMGAAGPQSQFLGNMTDRNPSADLMTGNTTSSSFNNDTMGGTGPDNSDMEGDGMNSQFGADGGPWDSQDGPGGPHDGPGGPHGGPRGGPHGGPRGGPQDGTGQLV